MKAPASAGVAPANSSEGERKTINSELWHACAGPLVSLPPVGSLVVYFPQGHSEQVAASMQKGANTHIPNYPNLSSKLICMLHNVTLHADAETDEVYAQMTLQPVNKFDKEALLASDLGLKQSRQPTEFFCKTLTASDTSTHGGFSVPRRAAEKIFPPLDFSMQPPAQELVARDLHDVSWTFRHIYRGQPKRHLLTTGWSVFVSAKRLVAGDSVLFIRDDKSQLLLGIRRANRQQPAISSSVLSSDSMHIGILAAAAHAAANHSPFTVFYNPRASPSEFVVPFAKYHKAVYGTQISLGMRFRMMFETEESSVRRYMGTITGISDLDPIRWKNSHWRNLQVGWDESTAGERQNRVSLWEIEPVITPFFLCPPPFFRPKCFRQPGMPGEELEIDNAFKNAMPWLTDDIGIKDVQNPIQHGMSLVQWMNMQQNPQILASVNQADCFPSITPSQLHNVGVDDPSKQLALQSHVLPLPNLQFGLPNLQQQSQQLDGLQHQNRTLANPYAQPQKPGISGQQLQQQQLQQQQQQQQQVSQAALQCLISQPLTQSQLQNQLLQQNIIQSKLQQQQLLGVNQQQLLLSNQNPLQSSLLQQSLQFQKQIPEQQQSLGQQQQQQQLPLAANQLQLQLLQNLQQQQQLQQSQAGTNLLPQQIPPLQVQLQNQLIAPAHQQSQQQQQQQQQQAPWKQQQQQQQQQQQAPWQQQQQQQQQQQATWQQQQQQQQQQQSQQQHHHHQQQLQQQQMNPSFHQIGGAELFHSLPNQPPPRPPHQEGQLISPPPQSLPVSSQLMPVPSQLFPVSASHVQAPTKGSLPARADSVFTDDDSRSSSTSPLANNRSASSSFINRGQQCSVRVDDTKRAVNNNLLQEPQHLKANPQIKHEFLPKQEIEQVSSQMPSRNNTADYLDATSCTSFCLEGGQLNVRTSSFLPSSAILRDSNPDGDIQVDPRNNLLFGVNIDGPLPSSLESDTLFPNGFGSAKDLQNLISGYSTPRDIEPELSTSAICSQSFGVQDMSFKPGCSNGAAINEAGFINKSSRPQALQRVRTFTKVYKRGSVGRSIDVTRYKGYEELRHDLACRFGIQGQLEDPQTSCWKLVYVDHENDILLVGDDPWEEFVSCVQSIKILSTVEVQQMSLDGDLGNMQIPNQTCSGSQENVMWRGYCEDNSGNHSLASFDH